jgi:arylsulfatase A-like enzyme
MNIILIISDTFRRDNLGCYGDKLIRTPNLDVFAEKAIVFDHAYAASFPTVPNRHDIFTGRFTFTYSGWEPLPKDEVVLSQILGKNGYITQLIADTPHILKDGFNYDRGFSGWWWIRGQENDRYMTSPKRVSLPCAPHKLRNRAHTTGQHIRNNWLRRRESDYIVAQTMTAAVRWLELNYTQEGFFLHVDTFDPHEPWDPPRWYVDMYDPDYQGEEVTYPVYGPCDYLSEEELNHCRAMYAGEVTMVDKWIGMLLQKIESLGLLKNTAVIFTTDHGFYLGEHGVIGKSIIMEDYHSAFPLYEEVSHIPLIMHLPGFEGGRRCDAVLQPPDFMPTILQLAGIEEVEIEMDGLSIVPVLEGEKGSRREFALTAPKIIDGSPSGEKITISDREWTLLFTGKTTGKRSITKAVDGISRIEKVLYAKEKPELYHIPTDPKQLKNVFEENEDVAQDLHAKCIAFLRRIGTKEEVLKYWGKLHN